MPEGVNLVWGRDGLLLPKRGNEASSFPSSDHRSDQSQVALKPVSDISLMTHIYVVFSDFFNL